MIIANWEIQIHEINRESQIFILLYIGHIVWLSEQCMKFGTPNEKKMCWNF